jgi:hypothetical protein
MSTHPLIARRTQLRSRALQEPYLQARAQVLAMSRRDPVIAPAGVWQRRLEGHIFRHLGYFHIAGKHQDAMRITKICPGVESLEISFSDVPDYQVSSVANSLPTWYPGDHALANGYPGLRYRPLPEAKGIEFYILGQPCSIKVSGVSVAAFEKACRSIVHDELEGARTEQRLHHAEATSTRPEEHETDLAVSAIIRRAGILLVGNADSIDLWPTRPDRLSIEIITQDRSQITFNKLIKGLTSAELSPRMVMTETAGHNGYRTMLRLEDRDTEIDLRIQTF